jgi:hypothetical protein
MTNTDSVRTLSTATRCGVALLVFTALLAGVFASASAALPISTTSTPSSPERVLLLGDSLSASISPALEERLSVEGIEFVYTGFPGTGPLTFQGTFWRESLAEHLASFSPDLVIIQASGNYNIGGADPFVGSNGVAVEHRSEEFFEVWNRHVNALIDLAEAGGADTLLVTAPVVADVASSHPVSDQHNTGYVRLARKTAAELLDWNQLLAPGGTLRETISADGIDLPLRHADGLHFAPVAFPVVADWLVGEFAGPAITT